MLISLYKYRNHSIVYIFSLIVILSVLLCNNKAFSQLPSNNIQTFFPRTGNKTSISSDHNNSNQFVLNATKIQQVINNINKIIHKTKYTKTKNINISKLIFIKQLYQNLLELVKKQYTLKQELKILNNKLKNNNIIKPSKQPPYNLSFYDSLIDQISRLNQEIETLKLDIKLTKNLLNQLKYTKNLIIFNYKNNNLNNLNNIIQNLNANILRIRLNNLKLNLKILKINKKVLQSQVNWVRKHLYFDKNDLDKQIQNINAQKLKIKEKINQLLETQQKEEKLWKLTIEKLHFNKNKEFISTQIQTKETWLKTTQLMLQQYEEILKLLDKQKQIWIERYKLLNNKLTIKKLLILKHNIKQDINNLNKILNIQQNYQINLQSQLALIDNQLHTSNLTPQVEYRLISLEKALKLKAKTKIEYIIYLFKTIALEQKLLNQIDYKLSQTNIEKTILTITSTIDKFLNFSIWTIDNNAVTVKKLIISIIVFILGILGAKYSVRKLRIHLINSTQLEDTTISAIEKITFYTLVMMVVLLALKIVHIPLEAFAFLGGALAIGIGFGAQNLINNFISGFIMMAERPISIGDIIEIEGKAGIVEEIGARCTRIRTIGNIHILVPNSSFLEKNITNWTLSDRRIRISIDVGVAYGSPVKQVQKLLIEAVKQCENTLKHPEPLVIFKDFGDNALIFKLYFWISLKKILERDIIASEVRFKIDELFRKANIVIAFPQRDVHLDNISPIRIKIDKD